jgi:two-component system, chemotaxis family, CheB/CheR fusion protein
MLADLFRPFTQADRTLDRSAGGLGLGLALVRGLIELHGGEVFMNSAGPGQGTEITLSVPVESAPETLSQEQSQPSRSTARRVLIIEDNADAAESLKEALELDGHHVELASSGPAGLEHARACAPDVVLCDIGLPMMDGYEVARLFRADGALRGVPLVALTGYALAADQKKALDAGFDRHLSKPADLGGLQRILAELPSRRAAPRPA